MAALHATAGREEATDDAGDVVAETEVLGTVHTDTLHTETETADAGKDHRMAVGKVLLQQMLQLRDDTRDGALGETALATGLSSNLVERHLALTDGLRKVFTKRAAALDIILNQFDMYRHNFIYQNAVNTTTTFNILYISLLQPVMFTFLTSPFHHNVKQLVLHLKHSPCELERRL